MPEKSEVYLEGGGKFEKTKQKKQREREKERAREQVAFFSFSWFERIAKARKRLLTMC